MSTSTVQRRPRAHTPPSRMPALRRTGLGMMALFTVTLVVAVVLAVAIGRQPSPPVGGPAGPLAATGEYNAMGMPVLATPGSATGTAAAGGVEVSGADWNLGEVPLDVAVRPSWILRNTGGTPVELGEPKAEVRAGCCPGPLTLGTTSLAPGESTTLTFELAMHTGMDGWHDLAVHVPVSGEAGPDHLVLGVVGDFAN